MVKRKSATKRREGAEHAEPEYESMVGRVLINHQRRVGLVTSDCAAWTRMLRIGDDCIVKIAKSTADELAHDGWKPYECEFAAFKLANTLAQSPLMKTRDAAAAIVAVQAEAWKTVTLEQAASEYARLTGNKNVAFVKRDDAIRRLKIASAPKNVEHEQEGTAATRVASRNSSTKETEMAATKKVAKSKAKGKPAAKGKPVAKGKPAAKGKSGGIGALVRELITKGKGNEEIVDTVLQKFPGARTNAANISWYRNQMKRA